MKCNPQVLLHRKTGKPKISVILTDWGVRESFHSVHYLNEQTADRRDYELIWVEFYDRKPEALRKMVTRAAGSPVLDKWLVLGYPDDCIFHKHRLYNAGLLAATGEVCVVCHSDAIFRPTFIENLIRAFEETPGAVVHLDAVRNEDYRFYPFSYPTIEEILGVGCVNWHGQTTRGLNGTPDILHEADYGACLAARRRDLLAIGGADEHLDYLGHVSGPYEMTFRLINYHGRHERWLRNEYLYHVWHANADGISTDYHGPHDGRFLSLRALDARATCRVKPHRKNPLIGLNWWGESPSLGEFLHFLKNSEEPAWRTGAQPAAPPDCVYWAEREYQGFNLFAHAGRWYALRGRERTFNPEKARRNGYASLVQADTLEELQAQIDACAIDAENRATGAGFLDGFRRKLFAQPLHTLPARVLRKARRLLSSSRLAQPPWQPLARAACQEQVPVEVGS